MLLIGENNGASVYLGEAEGMNRHVVIFGKSGSGKTVGQLALCARILENGGTVFALDLHGALSAQNVYAPLRDKVMSNAHVIDAYQNGIPANLFAPAIFEDGVTEREEDTAAAVCDVIVKSIALGSNQRVALRKAAKYVIEHNLYEKQGLQALDEGLRIQDTEVAIHVADKLEPLIGRRVFIPGADAELVHPHEMNIVRLGKFDDATQTLVSELLLAYIWRRVLSGELRNIYIVIDEFQNIGLAKHSALEKFLVEGRKYGIGLLLATQGLGISFTNSQQRLLLQAGIQLYFKPGENEIRDVARILGANDIASYAMLLHRLKIGECVAMGPIQVGEKGHLTTGRPTVVTITI